MASEDSTVTVTDLIESSEKAADEAKKSALEAIDDAKSVVQVFTDKAIDSANKVVDSSKDYLHKTKENIRHLTNKASEKTKSYQANISKAIQNARGLEDAGASTHRSSDTHDESLPFPLSILAWCSTLCSKTTSTSSVQGEQTQSRGFVLSTATTHIFSTLSDATKKLEDAAPAFESQVEEAQRQIIESAHQAVATLEEHVHKMQSDQDIPESSSSINTYNDANN